MRRAFVILDRVARGLFRIMAFIFAVFIGLVAVAVFVYPLNMIIEHSGSSWMLAWYAPLVFAVAYFMGEKR